jgi:protein-disulfide isomerase
MSERSMLQRAADVALIAGVLVIGGLLVRREFFPPRPQEARRATVKEWRQFGETGLWLHDRPEAPVQIVVFSDFQCPFCARLVPRLDSVSAEFQDTIGIRFRQFPLDGIHPYARTAARAALCAAEQGKFHELHDAMFAHQDEIGVLSWGAWAARVAIPDTAALVRCMTRPDVETRVADDVTAGNRLELTGTPTLLINNQLVSGLLTTDALREMIRAGAKGR